MSSPTPAPTEENTDGTGMAETLLGESSLVGSGRPRRAEPSTLTRGTMLGRYIVLETLGRGGMGVVYTAYDPELDRKVALKLLLPGRGRGDAARLRLQREAQAIARLSHPNVVAVHDVGSVDDQVFIAMELVDGMDLGRWLAAGEHSQAEILDRFLQAGAGLAAAHAAELVHRDFKPENVLVGHDGRARVVDFGLVRKDDTTASLSDLDDALPLSVSQRRIADSRNLNLTDAGSMLGTPAYMSPEQFLGQPGDARADQFSFCVSLYEALHGERPFAGDDVAELSFTVTQGQLRPPPAQHRVSGRLRRVLLRGLAVDPEARYPTLEALLTELRKAAAPRRWPWVTGGALGLGGALALWVVTTEERACAWVADRPAAIFGPERQDELRQRFDRTELPFAADTWVRVETHLDGELRRWVEVQQQVCEANVGLEPQVAAGDPRQQCLDERLAELGTLLGVLDEADRRVVTQAVQLAHGLAAADECAEPDHYLLSPLPSDPQLRAQVQELRADLRRWSLRSQVGQDEQSAQTLQALAERIEALGYGPLRAEVSLEQSDAAASRGEIERAIELENRTFETALASRHDLLALKSAIGLVFMHGVTRRELEDAEGWARRAEALYQRIGGKQWMRLQLLNALASTYALAGDDPRARAMYEEALEITREDEDLLQQATVLNNTGAFHAEHRRLGEARSSLEEAASINDDLLGPDHPSSLRTRANLGIVTVMDGQFEEGLVLLEAVLPRQEAVLGPSHPEISNTLEGIAVAHIRLGESERAEAMRRRVVQLREAAFGPASQPVISAKSNLGNSLLDAHRYAEARDLMLEIIAALDNGVMAPRQRVHALMILSVAIRNLGDPKQALEYSEQAKRICDEPAMCTDEMQVDVYGALAAAKLELGDRAAAKVLYEKVLQESELAFRPWLSGQAHFGLAKAMVDDEPEQAIAMARRARDELADLPDSSSRTLWGEVDAWLREHEPKD